MLLILQTHQSQILQIHRRPLPSLSLLLILRNLQLRPRLNLLRLQTLLIHQLQRRNLSLQLILQIHLRPLPNLNLLLILRNHQQRPRLNLPRLQTLLNHQSQILLIHQLQQRNLSLQLILQIHLRPPPNLSLLRILRILQLRRRLSLLRLQTHLNHQQQLQNLSLQLIPLIHQSQTLQIHLRPLPNSSLLRILRILQLRRRLNLLRLQTLLHHQSQILLIHQQRLRHLQLFQTRQTLPVYRQTQNLQHQNLQQRLQLNLLLCQTRQIHTTSKCHARGSYSRSSIISRSSS